MHVVDPVRYVKLKASGQLPSLNGVALAIVRLLQRDDYKVDDLVRLIQSDPAIAGALLKFSNAASFGHSRPIVSISKAVITLGTLRVRVLVLALSVLQNHREGKCAKFDYSRFWSRALAAAISAQALASYSRVIPEENFTAGLLCSVGELALASIFPDRYGEIISASVDSSQNRLALEHEAFDTDHRELAATLLLEWGLPEVLATAIYHCEMPDEGEFLEGSRLHGMTLSLQVALALADTCVADDATRWTLLPNLFSKAARLGISTEDLSSMADGIIASWREWGELLKIQTHGVASFSEMLASPQPREILSNSVDSRSQVTRSALLIGTEPIELTAISGYLESNGCAVKSVSNSTEGLLLALEEHQDLVIIEMSASNIDGAAFCKALRSNTRGQSSYIIFILDQENTGQLKQVLDMDADDILLRPITAVSLHGKLRGVFRIIQLQQELIKERNGLVNFAGEWAGTNRRLTHVAMTDPLTQIANRRHGMDFLASECMFSKSNHLPLACLMIDIDHFKQVNDKYGHKGGDTVLEKLAVLLQAGARSGDLVFRYGGEEFCIICPGATLETARAVAERIRLNVADQPFSVDNAKILVTVSIGVAIMKQTHADEESLIRDADTALYRAKESGRNRICC
jgi:diguanylate cyclase (GGDEF)-like protein